MDKLPTELITEIIYPEFHVPDETFRDISEISPFFRPTHQPCSALLQVCKSWMAVGTSLLYHVVVLRSAAQAQALQRTLREHGELGAYIKKLRVEGAFGESMRTIITSAPNITDLGLSLDIRPSESTQGLVRSLATINPTCLVVLGPVCEKTSAPLRQLHKKIMECLKLWSNLNDISIPNNFHLYPFPGLANTLVRALSANLQTLTLPGLLARERRADLGKLVRHRSDSLKRIWVVLSEEDNRTDFGHLTPFLEDLCASDNLREMVALKRPAAKIKNQPYIALPRSPLYVPLDDVAKETSDFIWDRVLCLAIEPELHRYSLTEGEPKVSYWERRFFTPISQVSKTFHRLSLPYINGTVEIGDSNIRRIAGDLQREPSRGHQMRFIMASGNAWMRGTDSRILYAEYLGILLSKAPRLVSFSASCYIPNYVLSRRRNIFVDWPVFETLAYTAGPNLVCLYDIVVWANPQKPSCVQSPALLSQFSALCELGCGVQIDLDTGVEVSPGWLPRLEVLNLHDCSPSFLDVLSVLSLPCLRECEITYPPKEPQHISQFLQAHGPKIVTLAVEGREVSMVELCPNATKLIIISTSMEECGMLHIKKKHENLSKIVFAPHHSDHLPSNLMNLNDYSMFPALREIQILKLKWPVTQNQISESLWPECSEMLAAHGIKLVDLKGISWRPRLRCF